MTCVRQVPRGHHPDSHHAFSPVSSWLLPAQRMCLSLVSLLQGRGPGWGLLFGLLLPLVPDLSQPMAGLSQHCGMDWRPLLGAKARVLTGDSICVCGGNQRDPDGL